MRRVIILGAAQHERIPADYDGEVWGCNSLWRCAFDAKGVWRATRWFELHPRSVNKLWEQADVYACPVPIYVLSADEWDPANPKETVPTEQTYQAELARFKAWRIVTDAGRPYLTADHIETFPFDQIPQRIAARYPLAWRGVQDWFRSTFAFQMALAIGEGFEWIRIQGCDLSRGSKRERLLEWGNLAWWIGYAQGLGITVEQSAWSRMTRQPEGLRYGYDYHAEAASARHECEVFVDPKTEWA